MVEISKAIKQSQFKDSFFKAYINLIFTANYFRDAFNSVFQKYGITGQHYNVLRIIKGKHPEKTTPGKIKEVMLDKGADLTRLMDKLERYGWIERQICPDNRRLILVGITPAGIEITENIDEEITLLSGDLRCLEDQEYKQLSELLDKMRG
ncbi:MAG: MarR family transcriptional regulator [Saprospiraceae bacterium]|nr:MarR family transcriptional regulator [Saprospiraceae bacterium]